MEKVTRSGKHLVLKGPEQQSGKCGVEQPSSRYRGEQFSYI